MESIINRGISQRLRRWGILIAGICLLLACGNSKPASAQNGYVWKNAQMSGANAWVTGLLAQPLQNGLFYCRTDVGGAYRFDSANSRWIPITDFLTIAQSNQYSIESIAIDPKNVNVICFAGGFYTYQGGGAAFRSTDQGNTWTQMGLNVAMGGNEDRRWGGERLVISPKSGSGVMLFGSRTSGLWRSTDNGATWSQVAAIPTAGDNYGVQAVAFDPVNPGVCYAAVSGSGVYQSLDDGATWHSIGGSTSPRRLIVGSNAALWYTNGSGVSKYSGNAWTNYAPGGADIYNAEAINPSNANDVLVEKGEANTSVIWRTTDGGSTWTQKSVTLTNPNIPWFTNINQPFGMSNMVFDPANTNSVWYVDGLGMWRTTSLSSNPATFSLLETGREENVTLCLATPPSGTELFLGVMDVDGFAMNNGFDAYPSRQLGISGSWTGHTSSISYEESNPSNMVRTVGQSDVNGLGVAKSTDNGLTWNMLGGLPANQSFWRVAMSATNANNIVEISDGGWYNGSNWSTPSVNPWNYTTNGGATWATISGLPQPLISWSYNSTMDCLKADPVNGSKFYYMDTSGKFYRSTNGGASFSWVNSGSMLPAKNWLSLKVRPGVEGDVWVSVNDGGLYHSTDSGTTWAKINSVVLANLFAIGAPQTTGGTPALFLYGELSGDTAQHIYRSLDLGATWLNITDPNNPVGNGPGCMDASRERFGVVIIGTQGRGFYYGAPGGPPAPTGLNATPGNTQVVLTWDIMSGATSYNVKRSTVSGSGYVTIASPAVTNYTDTGLTNGVTYYYVVTSVGSAGESVPCPQVAAQPFVPVPQAQIAPGTPVIDGTVDSVWSTATSYTLGKTAGTISGSSDCSGSWQGLWDTTNLYVLVNVTDDVKVNDSVNPWDDDAVEVYLDADHNGGTAYDANDRQIIFGWGDTAAVEGGGRGITGVAFAKADPTGTTYRIEAKIPWAVEAFTPAANAIIGIDVHVDDDDDGGARDGKIIWNDVTDQAYTNPSLFGAGKLNGGSVPPVPTGLNATAGNSQVVLTWGIMSGATTYNVKRSTVSGSGYVTIASPGVTNYTNTGLTNGTTYYYVASSVNANGESANCAQVSATPQPAIPAAPTGLTATPGNTEVVLTWSASTGATSYNALRSTVSGSGYASVATGIAGTLYANTGLTNGTTYYFVVSATNAGGTSANSAQASAAPSAAPQAQIANAATAPVIDGNNTDAVWSAATSYNINNVGGTVSSSADLSGSFKAAWDTTNLYVLVDVTDDVKVNDSVNPWDDDAVEIYVDGGNNKTTTYDANDRQVVCGWGDAAPVEGQGRSITGVTFAKADPTGTTYRIEAKIPWSVLGVTAVANNLIGIDVSIDDDDDGGARDGSRTWNDATGTGWSNPSVFGTGKLLPPAATGSLTGSVANTPATVNLTTEGTIDWAHWGLGGVLPGYDHKSTGGTKISNYTATGTVSAWNVATGQTFGYNWTDGTPTASVTNSESGVSVPVVGNNFVITAPADTTTKTLKVYCGGWQSRGQITAHLSDGSAVDYVDSSQTAGVNASFNVVYTLTYKAASAGQTLTVTWKENTDNSGNGGGNSSLQAASLH